MDVLQISHTNTTKHKKGFGVPSNGVGRVGYNPFIL